MATRLPLSPLTNSPQSLTPLRQVRSKIQSPSNSKHLSNFEDADEGRQKKAHKRRSAVHELFARQKIASSGSTPPSSPGKQSEALNGLTNAQLQTHYSDCIKLSTENKINAKNAFGLHLIDYMTDLVKKKELNNFQVASSTLDASVKIYAGRVDNIHTNAYKILSGLGGNHKEGADGPEDPDNPEEGMDEQGAAKVKKKKKTRAQTIETNLKNINEDKVDLGFEVDPMFQMMSAAFDEGGASGLLLNRLRAYEGSQALVLDASTVVSVIEPVTPVTPGPATPAAADVASLRDILSTVSLEDKQICPSLADFRFMGWDRDQEASLLHRETSDFVFDPHMTPANDDLPTNEDVSAIAHTEIAEADGDEDNASLNLGGEGDVAPGDMRTAEFVDSAFTDLTQGSMGKLRQILASEPSDYSYFNKVMMQTWAGPNHWKVTHRRAPGLKAPDSKAPGPKRRQKKPPRVLDCAALQDDLLKKLKLSKATSVKKATWAKYTKKRTTLPDDQHSDNKELLFKLFNRPKFMIKMQRDSVSGNSAVDDDIDTYDYDNKNDADNYCPLVRDDDDDEEVSGGFDLSNEVNFGATSGNNLTIGSMGDPEGLNVTNLSQGKLVAAPHKVQKIDIKYAKAAKRVDVKRLKSTMWQILTKKEVIGEVPLPVPGSQEGLVADEAHDQNFSCLKDLLPGHISPSMARNLTVQSVFACLLYLTNEKTLKLTSTEGMDDINIEQDRDKS